jgi:hypothetical protein
MKMRHSTAHTNGTEATGVAPRPAAPAWQCWLETIGLSAAFIMAGALLDRRDPFLLQRGFSWLSLAPLLAGLQFGATRGLASASAQALAVAAAWKTGVVQVPGSIVEIVLGWLIVGLLAGEFADAWKRRAGQLEGFGEHVRRRLESLGRAYLALKISHDRLQRVARAGEPTLRDALSAFRRDLPEPGAVTLESVGGRILGLFADHGCVRAATLHPVDRKGRPGPAVATLGAAAEAETDPLVSKAARSGVTLSVRNAGDCGSVLVAVPLIDPACRAYAVVAVQDLPFTALHAETLELLAVLGGRLGDMLADGLRPRSRAVADADADATPTAPLEPSPLPVSAHVEEAA